MLAERASLLGPVEWWCLICGYAPRPSAAEIAVLEAEVEALSHAVQLSDGSHRRGHPPTHGKIRL